MRGKGVSTVPQPGLWSSAPPLGKLGMEGQTPDPTPAPSLRAGGLCYSRTLCACPQSSWKRRPHPFPYPQTARARAFIEHMYPTDAELLCVPDAMPGTEIERCEDSLMNVTYRTLPTTEPLSFSRAEQALLQGLQLRPERKRTLAKVTEANGSMSA